jgi:hypothetical protein
MLRQKEESANAAPAMARNVLDARGMECIGAESARPFCATAPPSPTAAPEQPGVSFHDVLSALNPLQYVPVVGNIYRAMTGDTPPEPARIIGSFIASGLAGGPIGLAINAAVTAAEKITGIDPDHIAHSILAEVGIVGKDPSAPAADADATLSEAAAAAYARTAQMGKLI